MYIFKLKNDIKIFYHVNDVKPPLLSQFSLFNYRLILKGNFYIFLSCVRGFPAELEKTIRTSLELYAK